MSKIKQKTTQECRKIVKNVENLEKPSKCRKPVKNCQKYRKIV